MKESLHAPVNTNWVKACECITTINAVINISEKDLLFWTLLKLGQSRSLLNLQATKTFFPNAKYLYEYSNMI